MPYAKLSVLASYQVLMHYSMLNLASYQVLMHNARLPGFHALRQAICVGQLPGFDALFQVKPGQLPGFDA